MEFSHVSVLLKETVDGAFTDPNGVYADLTTGGGGQIGRASCRERV
mgnify:CR=1 FL=1